MWSRRTKPITGRGDGSRSPQSETETSFAAVRGAAGAKREHCVPRDSVRVRAFAKVNFRNVDSKFREIRVPAAAVRPEERAQRGFTALKTCVAGLAVGSLNGR